MITLEELTQLRKEADLYRETFYAYTHWKNQEQQEKGAPATTKSITKLEERFKKVKKEEQVAREEKTAKQEELPSQKKRQPRIPRHKQIKKQK
jgi:hypothetical protein